jgi:hypothetical protein
MPYIYLVHCRACLNANEHVYKIGKSNDFNKRLSGYDKGTVPIFSLFVNECDNFERHLLTIFRSKFNSRTDYGSEYFEGDLNYMINLIIEEYEKSKLTYNFDISGNILPLTQSKGDDIIKVKKMLLTKLNKINLTNIHDFTQNISLDSREFNMSQSYYSLNSLIQNFIYSSQQRINPNKLIKFGDYCENYNGFIMTLATTNDIPTIKLIERIKNAI